MIQQGQSHFTVLVIKNLIKCSHTFVAFNGTSKQGHFFYLLSPKFFLPHICITRKLTFIQGREGGRQCGHIFSQIFYAYTKKKLGQLSNNGGTLGAPLQRGDILQDLPERSAGEGAGNGSGEAATAPAGQEETAACILPPLAVPNSIKGGSFVRPLLTTKTLVWELSWDLHCVAAVAVGEEAGGDWQLSLARAHAVWHLGPRTAALTSLGCMAVTLPGF